MLELRIVNVYGREVLDSRGNPTVEAEIQVGYVAEHVVHGDCRMVPICKNLQIGRASVPSGASTGRFEAVELRDTNDENLHVLQAVNHINTEIRNELLGKNAMDQMLIDSLMIKLDGTENKGRLGANAILAVSMAVARAASKALGIPLFFYLGGIQGRKLPVPMMNVLNGGVHANNSIDIQEFMIMPVSASSMRESMQMGMQVYRKLKKLLNERGMSVSVGDEGGFAPELKDAYEVLDVLCEAIKNAGYSLGEDFKFALDVAASELFDERDGMYHFMGEKVTRDTNELISYYEALIEKYPIASIEDGLAEDDWSGWQEMTKRIGSQVGLVGDDLFVTNKRRLEAGIKVGAANAILIKMNQIGTVTETIEAVKLAQSRGYHTIISHRSGETEDSFIADLSVALNAGFIKTGAPCRGERTAKYNQLLRIEEQLNVNIASISE